MQFQSKPHWCGPASVYNALKLVKYRGPLNQRMLARIAESSEASGTDEHGIHEALIKLGVDWADFGLDTGSEAWRTLREQLRFGHPVILCLDNWQHWATAVGVLGNFVLVFDPGNWGYNMKRNGLIRCSEKGLLRRWKAARKMAGDEPPFYGISVLGERVL